MFALWLAIAGAACGQGVVPGTTYDQPLLSFSGTISPTDGVGQAAHPVVGLLWTDPLQRQPDATMPPRWMRSTVDVAADTFSVDIFRPPPPEAVVEIADSRGESSRLAVAEIVIVDDQDGDGRFQVQGPRATIASPDRYLAGSANVVTYVATPFPSPEVNTPLTVPGQSGYGMANYICQGQLSAATHAVNLQRVEMIWQPSQDLPDVRTCRASHGP